MTAFGISMSYYLNQQIPEARDVLSSALEAESTKIGKTNEFNARKIAEAYFVLGTMYEVNNFSQCKNTNDLDNCIKALTAYEEAARYNVHPYQSFLNRAFLYKKMDKLDEAIQAFSELIDKAPESDSAVDARVHRADLYLDKGQNKDALRDLEIACERQRMNVEYKHYLGLTQLKVGELVKAKKTYEFIRGIIPNKELKEDIIKDLKSQGEEDKNPDTKNLIREIVSTL
jgi:tetratricopeptide (TPR) repeat protein